MAKPVRVGNTLLEQGWEIISEASKPNSEDLSRDCHERLGDVGQLPFTVSCKGYSSGVNPSNCPAWTFTRSSPEQPRDDMEALVGSMLRGKRLAGSIEKEFNSMFSLETRVQHVLSGMELPIGIDAYSDLCQNISIAAKAVGEGKQSCAYQDNEQTIDIGTRFESVVCAGSMPLVIVRWFYSADSQQFTQTSSGRQEYTNIITNPGQQTRCMYCEIKSLQRCLETHREVLYKDYVKTLEKKWNKHRPPIHWYVSIVAPLKRAKDGWDRACRVAI